MRSHDVEGRHRWVNAQARGQQVRFSDAPCGSVGRVAPGSAVNGWSSRYVVDSLPIIRDTLMPVGLMGRRGYDKARARLAVHLLR